MASERTPLSPPAWVEAAIAENLHRFEIVALLDLLRWLGYDDDSTVFRSHLSVTRDSGLVHSIEFKDSPKRVVLDVNLGMLSVQSPLPAYLMQLMHQPPDFPFIHFMRFIDHPLLQARFAAFAPERGAGLGREWERMKEGYLKLMNLRTPASIDWLFRQVFPELQVSVRRTVDTRPMTSAGVELGVAVLGRGTAFGGSALLPTNGIEVRLDASDAHTGDGTPWATAASARVEEEIRPLVQELDLPLSVVLVLHDQETLLRLVSGHLLGYEPMARVQETAREVPIVRAPEAA